MTKKRLAALICAVTVLCTVVSFAVGFDFLRRGAARLEGDTSREVSLTVNADRNGNVLDSSPLIRFDSAEDAASQGCRAVKAINFLWKYAQKQLDAIRAEPGEAFAETQITKIRKCFGRSIWEFRVRTANLDDYYFGAKPGYGHAYSYTAKVVRGGTLIDISASTELSDSGMQVLTFCLNAREINAEVLSERSNRAALILIPLIHLTAGGIVLLLSLREYDKKERVAAAEKTLFTSAAQSLNAPLAEIKKTCDAALEGDGADLQGMYDNILKLNEEVLRLLAQARKF